MTARQLGRSAVRDLVVDVLLDQLPVVMFAASSDGVCTYSEGAGLSPMGLVPGELVGVNLFEAYADRPRELGYVRQALAGGAVSYTWRADERAFDSWLTPVRDADGAVTGVMGITMDVTERVRTQDDLDLYRAFVEAAPQFFVMADLDGRLRYLNPGGRAMVGVPPEVDIRTTTIRDYLTEEGWKESVEVQQPAILEHGQFEGDTTLRHWATGRTIPVRASAFLVTHPENGEPAALAAVATDLSAKRDAQRELERRLSQQRGLMLHLHQAQEIERRRIAHEVHDDTVQSVAALGIRLQAARRLLAQGEPDTASEVLDALGDSVTDAAARLRRLLVGLDAPETLEHDLVSALREHLRVASAGAPFELTVSGSLDGSPPAHVSRVLFRVAQEAVSNVRAHARAHLVSVEVGERDGGFTLAVRDDGVGLPPELAVSARSRPASAAGHLGLRGMVERAESVGGWCSVRRLQEREGGTLVEVWVPARLDYSSADDPDGSTARSLLEQTMESISEGFAALDRDWRYVYVNQVGADIVRRHDLLGKVCWEEFDFSPETEAAYRDAVRLQRPTVARVCYADLGRWVENRVFPSSDGVSVFFRDVTAEVELEQQADERQQVIRSGQALVSALVDEPDLETAVAAGLEVLRDAWGLTGLVVAVEHPPGRPLLVEVGDPAGATVAVPVHLLGEEIGSLRTSPTPLVDDLRRLARLLALRIAACG